MKFQRIAAIMGAFVVAGVALSIALPSIQTTLVAGFAMAVAVGRLAVHTEQPTVTG